MNVLKTISVMLLAVMMGACSPKEAKLSVLQLNAWVHTSMVPDGRLGLVDVIDKTNPDVVLLCELAGDAQLMTGVAKALAERGKTYHIDNMGAPVGIMSKYRLENIELIMPSIQQYRPFVKAHIKVGNQTVTLYSAHLDHRYYGPYLSRGYSAETWRKADAPLTDADSIAAINSIAERDEGIRCFIAHAKAERARGNLIIIGGDFNEPSYTDWQADTKDMREHRGVVANWEVSTLLHNEGYIDTYRERYPDPVTHPGFTWPAGNSYAPLEKLFFTPDADERDRIDFIWYSPMKGVRLIDTHIAGPAADVLAGTITKPEKTDETVIEPDCIWPSDHKGNLAMFGIGN